MKYQLYLKYDVIEFIKTEIMNCPVKETGGILIGYKTDNQFVVTHATGPGPKAKHSLFNFRRDVQYCNEQLLQFFEESDGVLTYLGEWHTHPIGRPIPSWVDDKEMHAISKTEIYQNDLPLLFIIRKTKNDLVVGSFLYENNIRKEIGYTIYPSYEIKNRS